MGKWNLVGLALFIVGAGVYEFMIRPTTNQATNFTAFKAERILACSDDGLETDICSCLVEKAARHKPLKSPNTLPSFKGGKSVNINMLAKIPAIALGDAYIRGTLVPSLYKLDKHELNEAGGLKSIMDNFRLTAAATAMSGCAPDGIFVDRESYRARGKKYYDVPHHMNRTFLVAEKRREMIASGDLSE